MSSEVTRPTLSSDVPAAIEAMTQAMGKLGEVVVTITPQIEGFMKAIRVARKRILRPHLVAERKKLRITARRWRRAQIEEKRRPALIHKGRKP